MRSTLNAFLVVVLFKIPSTYKIKKIKNADNG